MFKLLLILPMMILLVACGRSIQQEALEQAKVAIEEGDYDRGSLVLLRGCSDLHTQSLYLARMARHQASNDLMEMVYAWLAIEEIETEEDFIQAEAYRLIRTTLKRATISTD